MNKTTFKMIVRSIKSSAGRFAAIFAISALGVGFLAGISASTPDMLLSGSRYFNEYQLADIRVVSNIGFDTEDAMALSKIEGVKNVMPLHSVDMLFDTENAETHAITVIGFNPSEPLSFSVNQLNLCEGRLPENDTECLLERDTAATTTLRMGDTITLSTQNDEDLEEDFAGRSFTVVGLVENPYYMVITKEQTNIGNGKISDTIYVNDDLFSIDYYTSIYMTVEYADGELSLTDEYWDIVDPVVDRIETLADTQKYSRHESVLTEANEKIADAWATFYEESDKADREFKKAEDKMAQADIDIREGKITLAEKKAEAEEDIAEGERELTEAYLDLLQAEIDIKEGWEEYYDGLQEYEDAVVDFDEGILKYEDGLKEYEDGKKEYDEGVEEAEKGYLKLLRAQNMLDMNFASITDGLAALDEAQAELDMGAAYAASLMGLDGVTTANELIAIAEQYGMSAMIPEIIAGQAQIDENRALLESGAAQLDSGGRELTDGWEEYYEGQKELEEAKRKLLDAYLALQDAAREIEDGRQALIDAKIELEDGYQELLDGEVELSDGWIEYYDGKVELEDGKEEFAIEIARAEADIAKGERDLAEGRAELADAKRDAERELADAEYKILDAEYKLADIENPKWYVLNRNSMITPASFDSNIGKVAAIAKVFPVFFFLIAALVCLTTMTRMVEEERSVIGTMKALGYSGMTISAKYLIYAAIASVFGCIVGLTIGFRVFPLVIWNAFGITFRQPELYTPFNTFYAAFSSGLIITCIMGSTIYVCAESLKESAASLLLPKAPKPGKRVLLERVTFIWKRLSFNAKVTFRNLFRYKKRFLMTIVGISGCTALLVAGFGLRDSIRDILRIQFEELWSFDLMVGVKDTDETPVDFRLREIVDEAGENMLMLDSSGKASVNRGPTSNVSIYVPEDAEAFKTYVAFHERVSGDSVDFGEGKIVMTEKTCRTIGAEVGDTITLLDADDIEVSYTLSGIVENYIQGFVYMSAHDYETLFGEAPVYNTIIIKSGGPNAEQREILAKDILKCSSATSVLFTEDTSETFRETFKSIDVIIVVLIVCSALLAFVVLYNLTNINITERQKEIATLKVLGFFEGEVNSYILRETNLLSFIGALVGLAAGKALHIFIAVTAEVDMVMFGREVMPQSYLLSLVMTMFFSFFISLIMTRKLKAISMVESLKAPE